MVKKLKSFLLLLVLSVIPFVWVMYIWYSIPENIELEGLYYILCLPVLIIPIMFIVVLSFNFLRHKFGLEKLHFLVVLLVPLVINLISTNWGLIQIEINRRSYFEQYKGLDPEYTLIDSEFELPYEYHDWGGIILRYTLRVENATDKTFEDASYTFFLDYQDVDDGKQRDVGLNIEKITILPGTNVYENEIPLSTRTIRCSYVKSKTPLTLVIVQSTLGNENRTEVDLPSNMTEQLIGVADDINEGMSSGLYDLEPCDQ